MQVTTVNGLTMEISEDEAKRIAEAIHGEHYHHSRSEREKEMQQENEHYLERAKENIKTLAGMNSLPEDESDLKHILYENMPNITMDEADLLFEVIKMAIALHSKKIFSE